MRTSLSDLLATGRPLLADGATGTNYFAAGLTSGEPPEFWTVERAHEHAEALAAEVIRELPGDGDITFHTDPCERTYCSSCDLDACPVRARPFVGIVPLSVEEAVRPDPDAHR